MPSEICSDINCVNYDQLAKEDVLCRHHVRTRPQSNNAQFAGQFNHDAETVAIHETGAKRSNDADEHRFDLIPQRMLERVAKVMAKGCQKYGAHNWKKGFSWSSICNHLLRHAFLYLIGDKTEDHLAHMVCNLGFLIEFETTHPELNDIPSRK